VKEHFVRFFSPNAQLLAGKYNLVFSRLPVNPFFHFFQNDFRGQPSNLIKKERAAWRLLLGFPLRRKRF
ncbi:MAG: hypothetical protein OCC46_14315, partial [Pseudodesulfovibrio sp.]